MKILMRILAAIAVAGSALVSNKTIPETFGVVFTLIGTLAASLHPSVQAMVAYKGDAK